MLFRSVWVLKRTLAEPELRRQRPGLLAQPVCHIDLNYIPLSTIPIRHFEDDTSKDSRAERREFDAWLRALWREKDESLDRFLRTGSLRYPEIRDQLVICGGVSSQDAFALASMLVALSGVARLVILAVRAII